MTTARPIEVLSLLVWLQRYFMRCADQKLALPAPSKNRMRALLTAQFNARKAVTITPSDRLRRLQRVKRYLRNQSSRERDMPGHIREKMR